MPSHVHHRTIQRIERRKKVGGPRKPTERMMDAQELIYRVFLSLSNDDPALDFYKNDPVVMLLETDVDARVAAFRQKWFCSAKCLCPLLSIPINILFCTSAYMLLCFPHHETRIAAAHKLVLREKTLLLEVDEHWNYQDIVDMARDKTEFCMTCCHPGAPFSLSERIDCGVTVPRYSRLIRLVELKSIRLEPSHHEQTCSLFRRNTEPKQLLATISSKTGGDEDIIIAIAGPKNADHFIEKTIEQKKRVIRDNLDNGANACSATSSWRTSIDYITWDAPAPATQAMERE